MSNVYKDYNFRNSFFEKKKMRSYSEYRTNCGYGLFSHFKEEFNKEIFPFLQEVSFYKHVLSKEEKRKSNFTFNMQEIRKNLIYLRENFKNTEDGQVSLVRCHLHVMSCVLYEGSREDCIYSFLDKIACVVKDRNYLVSSYMKYGYKNYFEINKKLFPPASFFNENFNRIINNELPMAIAAIKSAAEQGKNLCFKELDSIENKIIQELNTRIEFSKRQYWAKWEMLMEKAESNMRISAEREKNLGKEQELRKREQDLNEREKKLKEMEQTTRKYQNPLYEFYK